MKQKINRSKRKFLLLLPLPHLLLVTLSFSILDGGGSSSTAQLSISDNLDLHTVMVNSNHSIPKNELSHYKKADTKKGTWNTIALGVPSLNKFVKNSSPDRTSEGLVEPMPWAISNVGMVKKDQKLHQKQQQLQRLAKNTPAMDTFSVDQKSTQRESEPQLDLDQLEEIINQVSNPQTKDHERNQLNELLETVFDIQHPKRVTSRLKETKKDVAAESVSAQVNCTSVRRSCLKTKRKTPVLFEVDFCYLYSGSKQKQAIHTAITTIIHEVEDIFKGSKVSLRFDQEITRDGTVIRRVHIIY